MPRSNIIALAVALAGTAATAPAFAAPGPIGMWRTETHHGVVEISACGDALCGRVVSSDVLKQTPDLKDFRNKDAALRGRGVKGLEILKGFTGGPEEWKGGSVYNPEDGGTYHGTIKVTSATTLKLTGCVVAPFCRTQTWTRAQ